MGKATTTTGLLFACTACVQAPLAQPVPPNHPISICEFSRNPSSFLGQEAVFVGQWLDLSSHGVVSFDTSCPNLPTHVFPDEGHREEFRAAVPPGNVKRRITFRALAVVRNYYVTGIGNQERVMLAVNQIENVEVLP